MSDPPGLHLVVDLSGRPCLVVGGGPVAARKVLSLLGAGAVVTVVALETVAAIDAAVLEAAATGAVLAVERRPYRRGEAAGYALVVTATGDPTVDDGVVDDARAADVLVNRADSRPVRPGGTGDEGAGHGGDDRSWRDGTVQLPAVLRRGPVSVAVSTGGISPALARWLRDRIATSLPARLETVAALVDEAREERRATGRATDSVDWADLLDHTVVPLVDAGRVDEARAALRVARGTDVHPPGGGPSA